MKLLIVDDDPVVHTVLVERLEGEGYSVESAYDGKSGLEMALSGRFSLVILDIKIPFVSGIEFIKTLREKFRNVPVMMLTSTDSLDSKLDFFREGADDYVQKPFQVLEVVARVRALLKRGVAAEQEIKGLKVGLGYFDFEKYSFTVGKNSRECRKYEILILKLLSSSPGRIFSRDEILHFAWGSEKFPTDRTIDNYIVRLRSKLSKAFPQSEPEAVLESIYGVGYRLNIN